MKQVDELDQLNRKSFIVTEPYPERVLQFGEGNFLRAFVDWQFDKMNKLADWNTGVVIVQPQAGGLVEKLNEQDGLYTVILEGMKDGQAVKEHTVVECVTRGLNPYGSDWSEYEALSQKPELRFVVSNTTEAGIAYGPEDRLEDRPQNSFPGKLAALLYKRFQFFNGDPGKGLVIIPCELIDRNGDALKEIVLKYADQWKLGAEFTAWLEEANTFCNSLVDRIVPGYPKDRITEIQAELGYKDSLVVVGEQYHLWVIEGPQWLKKELPAHLAGLNVLIVDDMAPYRTRKVRILNGAHTALTPVAYLYGLDTVGQAVEHDVVGAFIQSLIREEVIPTLDSPATELNVYADDVVERFHNPYVSHYVMSIALNSVSKFKTRNLPSLLQYVEQHKALPAKTVFSLASLFVFYRGKRDGEPIVLADEAEVLTAFGELWSGYDGTLAGAKQLTAQILGKQTWWGQDLNQIAGLAEQTAQYVYEITSRGMKETLDSLTGNSVPRA
ncbi:tagaturonate reductase [Paenibacillus sp. 23TSA30-6]|uniref:tagaturonate reductase n=1 Tax=Paenibacillus sp. 23TSA30-6 TaxID=2546104 RepID=UPI00178812AC|nr:tagaturonate reductase [Paenibacillus sp. 23TSA30-6]MBE0335259.1 tagaturonate reductase [Paenibacillus sp. 23TSA30-6]